MDRYPVLYTGFSIICPFPRPRKRREYTTPDLTTSRRRDAIRWFSELFHMGYWEAKRREGYRAAPVVIIEHSTYQGMLSRIQELELERIRYKDSGITEQPPKRLNFPR